MPCCSIDEDELKRVVFRSRRNECSVLFSRTDEGTAVQTLAAATGKARSPSVEWRVALTARSASTLQQTGDDDVYIDVGGLLVFCRVSARYGDAVPLRNDTTEH